MAKQVAVLLDGGYVQKRLYAMMGKKQASATDILDFARRCVLDSEELFRIYYYDCPPFGGSLTHPMSGAAEDYSQNPVFTARTKLIEDLSISDHVAFRGGVLSAGGWKLKHQSQKELMRKPRAVTETDFEPEFTQKRVDMKIGLDVAWLSSKSVVNRIVLVTADTDFVPAMKFARREGVQVVLVPMGASRLDNALRANADEIRMVMP